MSTRSSGLANSAQHIGNTGVVGHQTHTVQTRLSQIDGATKRLNQASARLAEQVQHSTQPTQREALIAKIAANQQRYAALKSERDTLRPPTVTESGKRVGRTQRFAGASQSSQRAERPALAQAHEQFALGFMPRPAVERPGQSNQARQRALRTEEQQLLTYLAQAKQHGIHNVDVQYATSRHNLVLELLKQLYHVIQHGQTVSHVFAGASHVTHSAHNALHKRPRPAGTTRLPVTRQPASTPSTSA